VGSVVGLPPAWPGVSLTHLAAPQVAEHKRAVDAMLAEKRAMFEAARAAEEAQDAARCVGLRRVTGVGRTATA
jgi:hypothetical protein